MMGFPARRPAPPSDEDRESGSLLGLVERDLPSPDDVEELRERPAGPLEFLGKPISPAPLWWHNKLLPTGLLLSFLIHLSIVALLPVGKRIDALLAQLVPPPKPKEEIPPVFLFPYLPQEKPEPPKQDAPLSDLDRRAHGGEGEPDTRPGSRGNTPEPRLEPGGEQVAQAMPAGPQPGSGADQREGQDPQAGLPGLSRSEQGERAGDAGDQGAGAVLKAPRAQQGAGVERPTLRGLPGIGDPGLGNVPDRPGGRVDVGPLSFDTQWYDWGPYAAEMLRRIRYHWRIPEIARLGVGGVVRIRFLIERDGQVTGLEIESVSGHPPMDFAARDAILNASPLPPLPKDLGGVDREGVRITFYYNTRPPE